MEQVSQLPDLHRKIAGWKDNVNEVRAVLSTMNNHLEQLAGHYEDYANLVQVEHFQNQFICQKEVADELFHDLKQVFKRIPKTDNSHEIHSEKNMQAYDQLNDRMQAFKKLFAALRSEFEQFAGEMA